MTENRDLYGRIGYAEYKRVRHGGHLSVVYMRKPLAEAG